ncbi:MAG: NUDIX domain-containing protein [Nocardioidaceae bacterium]
MPTPDFIVALRTKIGTDLLWLPGVTAVVFDDAERVLLTYRADDPRWHLVSGILEPGEQPVEGVLREVREETGLQVSVERMSSCWAGQPVVVPGNGDRCQFLDLAFRCRHLSGEPYAADEENTDVRWFPLDELPPLKETALRRIEHARRVEGPPYLIT